MQIGVDKFKLYELTLSQEEYFLTAHHTRVATYLGFASAILGATIAGTFKAEGQVSYMFLCLGPILVAVVANLGIKSAHRYYQRFLECITIRAKLEHDMALDISRSESGPWFESAPLVPIRHLKDRDATHSEAEFISGKLDLGDQRVCRNTFRAVQIISLVMFVALVVRVANLN